MMKMMKMMKKIVIYRNERVVLLKTRWLDLVDELITNGILNKECISSCLWYKEMQLSGQAELGTEEKVCLMSRQIVK